MVKRVTGVKASRETTPEKEELKGTDLSLSESDEEGDGFDAVSDSGTDDFNADDIDNAVREYVEAVREHPSGEDVVQDEDSVPADEDDYDSSEDERPPRNTVGEVPLEWYKDEEHIGYDRGGKKIIRRGRRDALERLLARADATGKELRTVYDEYNDEEIVLSKEELAMIRRIRDGRFPHVEVNPYEPEVDWFTKDVEVMPLSGAPEPKRRFIPSKWEEQKVVKLVRALRKGWIKTKEEREAGDTRPETYLLWDDDGRAVEKTAAGLTYIPAPKAKLPGHNESYNPPPEYLPTEEERAAIDLLEEEEKPSFLPMAFDALRKVPAYAHFIKERFERCLDLYLCPRTRRKRIIINDPETLVPQLPKPKDLQPFPTQLLIKFTGHAGAVNCVAPDPKTGQWLLTGGADGALKLWEVTTGRCMKSWKVEEDAIPIVKVAWCPDPMLKAAAVVAGKKLFILAIPGITSDETDERTASTLKAAATNYRGGGKGALAVWSSWEDGEKDATSGIVLTHSFSLKDVVWHGRGDYFASVAPTGNTAAVLVHQLSKSVTQNPFRKNKGRVVRVLFHSSKPFFFVATQQHVRIYNLAKQALAKKLVSGSGVITTMALHPSGDHLIVGSEDRRLAWFDLDLSSKPYRALRHHTAAVRGTAFHRSYPLFASCSDDGAVHVFHGMVYADLMTNPLIVPVKILRGHDVVDHVGVKDVAFHPRQPWVFTAGADGCACLFVNP